VYYSLKLKIIFFFSIYQVHFLQEGEVHFFIEVKYGIVRGDFLNKKFLAKIGLIGIVLFGVIAIFINKPNEDHFVQWLTENYDVNCKDVDCYELVLNTLIVMKH
jgi:hypothetical protein